jgi:hypothetical protein
MPALNTSLCFLSACFVCAAATAFQASAGEWPQILGPDRNGIAADDETLADEWPAEGPYTLWQRDVGRGYAGVAVAEKRTLLFHRVGENEVTEALDAATGKTLWTDEHPTKFKPEVGSGDGPLCVPVIQGGRVFTFGAEGVLTCLDAATGKRPGDDFNARGTWEETGLLLAKPVPERPAVGPWREFLDQGYAPDLSAVEIVARAVTPPMLAKRFDTWFLMANAEALVSLDRQPDCGELEEIAWVDFDDAIALPLPMVTRTMITEAVQRMEDPSRPQPYMRFGSKKTKMSFL